MSAGDFLRFPLAVRVLVGVMFWPVIWAGALTINALAGDLIRPTNKERYDDTSRD